MECSYSINEPHLTPNFLASMLQLDLPLVSVFQPGGGRGVGLLNGRSHMKVKMLGTGAELREGQHVPWPAQTSRIFVVVHPVLRHGTSTQG